MKSEENNQKTPLNGNGKSRLENILDNVLKEPPKAANVRKRVKGSHTEEKGQGEAQGNSNGHPVGRKNPRIVPSPSGTIMGDGSAAGRTTLLLDKVKMDRLIDALLAGNTIRNACDLSPISPTSFHRWMADAEGAPIHSPVWEFRDRVKAAMAQAEHRNVMIIQQAAKKNWQAAAWTLERRRPEEWGRRDVVRIGGEAGGSPVQVEVSEKPISDEELLAAAKIAIGRIEREKVPA